MTDREKELELALRNCLALARQQQNKNTNDNEQWTHVIRFCRDVGIVPNILRNKS